MNCRPFWWLEAVYQQDRNSCWFSARTILFSSINWYILLRLMNYVAKIISIPQNFDWGWMIWETFIDLRAFFGFLKFNEFFFKNYLFIFWYKAQFILKELNYIFFLKSIFMSNLSLQFKTCEFKTLQIREFPVF